MYENRETSTVTERGNKLSPASEGASRTAGMHVVEKSASHIWGFWNSGSGIRDQVILFPFDLGFRYQVMSLSE